MKTRILNFLKAEIGEHKPFAPEFKFFSQYSYGNDDWREVSEFAKMSGGIWISEKGVKVVGERLLNNEFGSRDLV